jgi:hypothetical protein
MRVNVIVYYETHLLNFDLINFDKRQNAINLNIFKHMLPIIKHACTSFPKAYKYK